MVNSLWAVFVIWALIAGGAAFTRSRGWLSWETLTSSDSPKAPLISCSWSCNKHIDTQQKHGLVGVWKVNPQVLSMCFLNSRVIYYLKDFLVKLYIFNIIILCYIFKWFRKECTMKNITNIVLTLYFF